jgi:thermopsin
LFMGLRLALLLLLSACIAFALITVPPMRGDFRVSYKWAEGPGFVAVVGIDETPRNVTLFTEEGFDLWMKDKPGTAVFNGMLKRGDVLIIETPPGRYVLAVYPQPIIGNKTQTYAKSYSGWAPVGVTSLPREPTAFGAAAGYFEVRSLKARNEGEVKDGASVQLNAMVVVELADGGRQYYFVQNVLDLYTDAGKYRFVAAVFNHTLSGRFTGLVKGSGKIFWHVSAPSYYGYATREERYGLPFVGFLLINVTATGGDVRIDFGYNLGSGVVWYDSVVIKPYAPVERAYILAGPVVTSSRPPNVPITPFSVPVGTIASLELVLCGLDADSPRAELEEVDVRLALLVWSGTGWRPAPRLYNFGFNTAEMVSLNVETRLVNGTVRITKGAFKPQLLAEEPPEPDIPPPYAAFKPSQADSWLLVAVAAFISVVAGGVWIRRRASRARRRSFRRL